MTLTVQDIGLTADRFRRASKYYTTGRPSYPPLLIKRVAELVGLNKADRVLDLGTGPGFLAIDFAAHVGHVTAIDPAPEMLEVARVNAAQAGAEISFVKGSSFDLAQHLGRFRLVSIGRAFHWMDREDALRRLDGLIEVGGAVVLFSDKTPDVPANAWVAAYREVREKYAAADRLGRDAHTVTQSNEAVLLSSTFSAIERHSVIERRATPLEHFVDRVLSFGASWSSASQTLAGEVAEDIRVALTPFAVDGIIHEVVEGRAVIARRP
jgi:SAM-dependent methyltransferase